ncbi:TRAP transporter substrate-binding protein [Pseudalkalibacillus caeni]|uniref:DctP family TRAP transporter solute-binding subunit n=1 Tax=Exobacillus caeni TaxID=2574798 RepID=A0A5R9F4G7_9BACL|nr:TRAP transporter substrate-binding protein [Pseudalkalibacillus caeni]TLS38427.1 DctP family TRAP transporter solute-binding subunit [Pseudalkalibacillus caeni]
MKKIAGILMSLIMVFALAACGENESASSSGSDSGSDSGGIEKMTLKVGHTLSDTSHYQEGLKKFKELVEEKSDGQITVEIFPNGSLGGEREMIEGLDIGTVDMVLSSTGPMSGFAPEVTVVDLPFLFRDADHAHKVLDGEIGQDLLKKLESEGMKGLSWWENGFRNVTNNVRPVEKPEDLKGLKLRTMENEIHMAAFEEMGADPTPMAFPELFTALQQGVVDGEENPVPVIWSSRFYEVQDYLTMTRHVYNPSIMLISKSKFDGYSEEVQNLLLESSKEAGDYERQVVQDMEDKYLSQLEEKGMNVITDVDLEPFEKAVQPVYDKYSEQFGKDLIENIKNTK